MLGIHDKKACRVLRQLLNKLSGIEAPISYCSTLRHNWNTCANYWFIYALNCWTSERRIVPFEKSNTSSERSLRIFSAFSHLLMLSAALLQMSGMKSYQLLFHSSLTIEINVEFILVKRLAALACPAIWSGVFKTKVIMKFRMFNLLSASIMFHRDYQQKKTKVG